MESDVPGGGGQVPIIVSTAVALTGLVPLIPVRLGQLLCLLLQKLVYGLLYALADRFLQLPLITSSFSCIIFSDMVCSLLSECCVVTPFYQRLQAMSLFFILRKLLYLIEPQQRQTGHGAAMRRRPEQAGLHL